MIGGIGIDIVEIGRIHGMIDKYQDQFLEKVFTPAEIKYCRGAALPQVHFSGRWAIKEAFYKALPMACQAFSRWKSVEILGSGESRKPVLSVIDSTLADALRSAGIDGWHVSISHEKTHCVGMVVLEHLS